MHDHRARPLSLPGLGLGLALGLTLCAACRGTPARQAQHSEMARDQLFFAAFVPEPVILALIVQRTRDPAVPGATLEAKAFLVARNRLQSLFWERVALDTWPGRDLAAVLKAWQSQRKGPGLRLSFAVAATQFTLTVRQPGGSFSLRGSQLHDIGWTADPHGRTALRAGSGELEVNGQTWHGAVLAETLEPGSRAWPEFGRFELWLAATQDGALWLGRSDLAAGRGSATVVAPGKPARVQPFSVRIAQTRRDAVTGFALPTAWHAHLDETRTLSRTDGQSGRGTAPGGRQAVYDISVAGEPRATALIFHLQDK